MSDREEFERWAEQDYSMSIYTDGSYCDRETSAAWEAWQAARRWIPVSERLPEKSGVPVIAHYKNIAGKDRRIRAAYVRKFTVEDTDTEYYGEADYCEESDTYFWPEGWYEWNETEDTHWMVEGEVIEWQPLPPLPEES